MAGGQGVEPRLQGPKPSVLPIKLTPKSFFMEREKGFAPLANQFWKDCAPYKRAYWAIPA